MSNIETHLAEQAVITAAAVPTIPSIIAREIIDSTDDDRRLERCAARAFLAVAPSYNDYTLSSGLADALTDIRHLCDIAGFDWQAMLATANRQYADDHAQYGKASNEQLAESIKHHME